MIAGVGFLFGYEGKFDFSKIGVEYSNVPFVEMRGLCAVLGALVPPIAYTTMRNFGYSSAAAILTSIFVIFENSFVTQFRLILLDSMLLFFTSLTLMYWSSFNMYSNMPFTYKWWTELVKVGICLGLTVSVKWVGLFLIALIGLLTLNQLWNLVTNPLIPIPTVGKHFTARLNCLLFLPLVVYALVFQLHFALLKKTGPGVTFMPPEFEATLRGSNMPESFVDVAYGSVVTIRHVATSGGYLHSHPHDYPGGSKQQQITCYPFRDKNSDFLILPPIINTNGTIMVEEIEGLEMLQDGDHIRLG